MRLEADGTAGFDEGALGLWAVDTGHRLVLIVRDQEMGREPDPLAERRVLVFTPSARVGDDLAGRFGPSRPGEPPRAVNARRCPER